MVGMTRANELFAAKRAIEMVMRVARRIFRESSES